MEIELDSIVWIHRLNSLTTASQAPFIIFIYTEFFRAINVVTKPDSA